jgi:hypothetical protein
VALAAAADSNNDKGAGANDKNPVAEVEQAQVKDQQELEEAAIAEETEPAYPPSLSVTAGSGHSTTTMARGKPMGGGERGVRGASCQPLSGFV